MSAIERLVIMNASSLIGQLCSAVLLGNLSIPTVTIIVTFFCTEIPLWMICVHTVADVVAFDIHMVISPECVRPSVFDTRSPRPMGLARRLPVLVCAQTRTTPERRLRVHPSPA